MLISWRCVTPSLTANSPKGPCDVLIDALNLSLPLPPSLHSKGLIAETRELFRRALDSRKANRRLVRKLYKVEAELWGDWLKADGEPKKNNADNILKVLLDEIGRVFELDDCWLDWDVHLRKMQTKTAPSCELRLSPLK